MSFSTYENTQAIPDAPPIPPPHNPRLPGRRYPSAPILTIPVSPQLQQIIVDTNQRHRREGEE